jgi:mono/diheme cytochrome c family protein
VRRALPLLAVAVVAGGCGGGASTQQDGQSVYTAACSACHSGNGPGPDLGTMQFSRADILRVIDHGQGEMPADLVGPRDAERIASYLTR